MAKQKFIDAAGVKVIYTQVAKDIDVVDKKVNAMDGRVDALEKGTYDDSELRGLINTNKTAIETLNGTGDGSVDKKVATAIAKVVADAPEDFDTLKEVADWIANDTTGAAKMQADIGTLTTDVSGLKAKVGDASVADQLKPYAKTAEVTAALEPYAKTATVQDAIDKAHAHGNKAVLDGIDADKVAAWDGAAADMPEAMSEAEITQAITEAKTALKAAAAG